ncbi:MAG: tyrosine--tRNA ligase [Verrucomicrobia bacterium]|nr:tyrosine--tRNA ligase [Verrucomicrobiota bacterium]MDA1066420.1 tyrosine--tRNA ligase [Verrucomicrobiota bacterium]
MNVIEEIRRGTDAILNEEELEKKLLKNRPLRVKLGADPTKPDLTLGHTVVLQKLRQFQDLGHIAVLIIGDFTARIGDPSGKSATRPELTKEEIAENGKTYIDQVYRILDPEKTEIHYNSEWLASLTFEDTLNLLRKMTVARMLERDDFSKRYKSQTPISVVEFVYPLSQGYDSVVLKADIELGGTDQLFNLLVGRQLQKDDGQEEQVVITLPLLVGLDGVNKMSKSLGNYIGLNDSAKEVFGKVMSISDDLMWNYWTTLFYKTDDEIESLKQEHPMTVKKSLAVAITTRLHDQVTAEYELQQFEQVFSKGQTPTEMDEIIWSNISDGAQSLGILELLGNSGKFPSRKEAKRLLLQGAVKVDGAKSAIDQKVEKPQTEMIIQAGKRLFFKVLP